MKSWFGQVIHDIAEAFWALSRIPYAVGRWEAKKDVKSGKIALRTFGPPAKWRPIYSDILKNHGIILEPVSDQLVGPMLREHIRGYNSVVKAAIRRKHGRDFLAAVVERSKEALLKQAQATCVS